MNDPLYTYDALRAPVTLSQIVDEAGRRMRLSGSSSAAIVTIVVFVVFLAFMTFLPIQAGSYTFPMLTLGAIVAASIVGVVHLKSIVRLRNFAAANNLLFLAGDPGDRNGLIFKDGHSRKITEGIATVNGSYHEIGNYQYTVGSGRNAHTYSYGFIRIKLPRRLPNMVLDAHKNNFFGHISNLPESFQSNQKMSLEGDFDKYFTLYAPQEYQQDALYVFTPDIMQLLIDDASGYDVEVVDDDLYLYSSTAFHLTDQVSLEQMFHLIGELYEKVGSQTDFYADDRVGDRAANVIAAPGQRLKAGAPWVIMFLIIVFMFIQFGPILFSLVAAHR